MGKRKYASNNHNTILKYASNNHSITLSRRLPVIHTKLGAGLGSGRVRVRIGVRIGVRVRVRVQTFSGATKTSFNPGTDRRIRTRPPAHRMGTYLQFDF